MTLRTFRPGVGRTLPPPTRTQAESAEARAARIERAAFYSSRAWRKVSRRFLAENPLCHWCGRLSEMSDHIVPRLDRPDLAFDRDNLRACCRRCHALHGVKSLLD